MHCGRHELRATHRSTLSRKRFDGFPGAPEQSDCEQKVLILMRPSSDRGAWRFRKSMNEFRISTQTMQRTGVIHWDLIAPPFLDRPLLGSTDTYEDSKLLNSQS